MNFFKCIRIYLLLAQFLTVCGYSERIGDQLSSGIKNMPKSELHLHLGGAWPLQYLKEVSNPQDFQELCGMLNQIHHREMDYHSAFQVFHLTNKIVNTDAKVTNGVIALCKDLLADQVAYVEIRTGLKNLGSDLEGYLQAVLKGIEEGTYGTSLQVGLILSLRRDTPAHIAEKTIDLAIKYRQNGIVGIDLSGDSTQGDGKEIFEALGRAKKEGFPITLHIGESLDETTAQQMLELTLLEPERIGHGVHLCDEAKKWVKEKGILVEMCLTSAVKAGMIKHANEHPALNLILEGHPVAICTDDPLIFMTTLSDEYILVAELLGIDIEQILQIQEQNRKFHFRKCAEVF